MKSTTPFSNALWICSPRGGGARTLAPAPYLRKAFAVSGDVKSARLTITALGLYECEINGERIGEQVFAPGWTDYRTRVQFQTFDVTPQLQSGENAIGVILGEGWYSGHIAWFGRQVYGDRPQLLAHLEVELADGTKQSVVTDASWKTETGPILENDFLSGESYDARLEFAGWSRPGFDDAEWQPVKVRPTPDILVVPTVGPVVKRHEELAPISEVRKADWHRNFRIFDFGQNFSGRARIRVTAPAGTVLTLRFAEILKPDGSPYFENLRSARVTDYYTCKGGGEETWEPRFTFHGFRFVEVLGLAPEMEFSITAIVLHSDTPKTGHFACSNPLLNQLQHNILWGQKSNFLEVPTDCPQRDERLGWTGDAQVFVRTAAFNMDVQGFFHKWMQDVRDGQKESGAVPCILPEPQPLMREVEDGGPAWSDATIICPWTIYLCYGDRKILEDHYDSMKRFLDYHATHRCKDFIRYHPDLGVWNGFGDWLALDGSGQTEGGTAKDLIGTAFYAYDLELMIAIAELLGHPADAEQFRTTRAKVVAAFQHRYVTAAGLITANTQTAYVLALHFGLIPESARANAAHELVRDVKNRGFHLSTGFVGTPYLLDVLEAHGHLDVAYQLLEQETFPSWLFPVKNGATTIWERWDGWTPDKGFQDVGMNSFNHYAYGAVGAWMVKSVAGLDLDPNAPGYRQIAFRPRPGGTITWAEASLETPQGKVAIRWDLEKGALKVALTVPAGSTATFEAPAGFAAKADSFLPGTHTFTLKPI